MTKPKDDKARDEKLELYSPEKPMRFLLEEFLLNSNRRGWKKVWGGHKIPPSDRFADTLQGTVLKNRQYHK
ncbi:hypothetical protein OLZ31_25675 [Enterobacter asburiae]|nr:hypothetical protein [Enterobacter asburiae]